MRRGDRSLSFVSRERVRQTMRSRHYYAPHIERDLVDLIETGIYHPDEDWLRSLPEVAEIRTEGVVTPFRRRPTE